MLSDKPIPFKPGYPVDPENFEGRVELIEESLNYLKQAEFGIPQHFFINGKRGMGKSSFAKYIAFMAEKKYNFVSIHIYNDGVYDVETLIKLIIEQLIRVTKDTTWGQTIFNSFKKYIDSINLLGNSIKFKSEDEKLIIDNVKSDFAYFLVDLTKNIGDKKGILIIIDDINSLSDTPDFVNWYKSFTDSLATNFDESTPVAMLLSSHPDRLPILYKHNPSFNRIFHHREISALSDAEVKNFFLKSFGELDMCIDEDALNLIVHFSSGHPTMMQEIGAGIYWTCRSKSISYEDALRGIIRSGEEIGVKYLKSSLDSSIRSNKYLNIFNKLGEDFITNFDGEYSFKKKDFMSLLDENEGKVFSDFLLRARQLGILEFSGAKKSGYYKFTNNLFPIYFAIKYFESEQTKTDHTTS